MYNNDLIAVAVTFINKKSILTQRKIFWKENIVFPMHLSLNTAKILTTRKASESLR